MERVKLFLLMGVLAGSLWSVGAEASQIRFIIKVPPTTPKTDGLFISGATPELCKWQPACIPLKEIAPMTYEATLVLPAERTGIEFKITRGTWKTEASDAFGAPLENFSVTLNKEAQDFVYSVIHWTDLAPLGKTGDFVRIQGFASPELGNTRDLIIWLPPSYFKKRAKLYPVIYAHDGQNIFDPVTSNTKVDWGIDEAMTRLIASNPKAEAIVVGINNTSERMSEYDFTMKGELYARFIVDRVKPFIDREFRTLPGRDTTFAMGSSMGGHISVALLWKYPEVFSRIAALSLPAFIHDRSIFEVLNSSARPKQSVNLYYDHGTYGGDAGYAPSVSDFTRLLEEFGLIPDRDFVFRSYEWADHREVDWARRVDIPLQFLLDLR